MIRKAFIEWKTRINYVAGTFGMFTMPLLLADLIQKKLLLIGVSVPYLVIVFIGFILVVIGGYILERTGFIEAETKYAYRYHKIKWRK